MEDLMEYIVNVYQKDNGYCYNSTHDTLHDAQIAVDELRRANHFLPDGLKFHGNLIETAKNQNKMLNYFVIAEF